jgi:hypothetical protein
VSAPHAAGAAPDGWRLPGYRLEEVIGQGGFATVYRAEQQSLGRQVAVKVLLADLGSETGRQRFDAERQLLSRLGEHPCVVDVHDAGVSDEGRPYVVMRLYRRGTLADRVAREGALDAAEVVAIVERLASALGAAHADGVLHRDVKPENVLLTDAGEPVLSDFGIAALLDAAPASGASGATGIPCTVSHAAPEVLEHGTYSVAADVYALASTAYELLAGRPAFPDTGLRTVAGILDQPPPPIGRPQVPPAVEAVVRQGLAKNPAERPPSAAAFSGALVAALATGRATPGTGGPLGWIPADQTVRIAGRSVSSRGLVAVVAVLGVAALTFVAGVPALLGLGPTPQPVKYSEPPAPLPPMAAPSAPSEHSITEVRDRDEATQIKPDWTTLTLSSARRGLAVDPVHGQIATAQLKGPVQIWDPATGKEVRQLAPEKNRVEASLGFSPDGKLIAGMGTGARVWRADGTAAPRALEDYSASSPSNVAFSHDGRHVVGTDRYYRKIVFWDVTTGAITGSVQLEERPSSLQASPDGRTLAVMVPHALGVLDVGTAWDPTRVTMRWFKFSTPITETETAIAFAPDGRTLAVAGQLGRIDLWNVTNGTVARTITMEYSNPDTLAFSPDGTLLATGEGLDIRLWDPARGTLSATLDTGAMDPGEIRFLPDGRHLAAVMDAGLAPRQSAVGVWTVPARTP